MQTKIIVKGAREHNLKNISIEIPRNQLVVITGPSGSGKSSLAFDTIYAEGQRRYVESLSSYARQFLQLMKKPDVDSIEGLSPAISIEQKTVSNNPRSTVATITEIYDYMRLLFARVGVPYSPTTGLPIAAATVDQIIDQICTMEKGKKIYLLAPVVRRKKGEHKKLFDNLMAQGYSRFKVNDDFHTADDLPKINIKAANTICVVVDRLVIPEEISADFRQRLAASVETSLDLGQKLLWIEEQASKNIIALSSQFACPESGFTIEALEPRLFSFNSPLGACAHCEGLGKVKEMDYKRLIDDPTVPLNKFPLKFFKPNNPIVKKTGMDNYYLFTLKGLADHYKFKVTSCFNDLSSEMKEILFKGSRTEQVTFTRGAKRVKEFFPGFAKYINMLAYQMNEDIDLTDLEFDVDCPTCAGQRLKPEALCVKIDNKNIADITVMSIAQAYNFFKALTFPKQKAEIAATILKEIQDRLNFLNAVGLTYLHLNRTAGTLSGGESQRIRLASQIGSRLTGVLYVLDEPSIGLHQRDNDLLISTLKELRDIGNSVLVVEHDAEFMLASDQVVDMGPFSGVHGGQIIAQGTPKQIMKNPDSITGQYLSGTRKIDVPAVRRKGSGVSLMIKGAHHNNLRTIDAEFPLGRLICVTGVSGSGKSSLVMETLRRVNGYSVRDYCASISGRQNIDNIIDIDQTPIGRTPRSNPATYVSFFQHIRDWYANLPESRARGYAPGRFSFNVRGGRCEACEGDGAIKTQMHFLADIYTTCTQCEGKRFNQETLSVKYKGMSIHDVLELTIDQALKIFDFHAAIQSRLLTLHRVGLGYIKLGQSATTLSGGEAQRIKLAKELSKRSTGKSLYILDEPTTGLHFDDIKKLLEILHMFVERGNTVVVIEHNLDVIKTADWIIDMGPEGGSGGGLVIAAGTPEDIVKNKASVTGKYLKKYL